MRHFALIFTCTALGFAACGGSSSGGTTGGGNTPPAPNPNDGSGLTTYGAMHTGQYNLGPVEWTGSFNNSCSPYPSDVQTMEGAYIAGLDNSMNGDGSLCDACILMNTAKGKSIVLRVVTTGVSNGPNDADISQAAFTAISENEYPRTMTWQLVQCPDSGKIQYQFQTGANAYWSSLWVRNARVPVAKVEVQSKNHPSFFALTRGSDGTLTDSSGFGEGSFMIRVTGSDGQAVTDTFQSLQPGALVASQGQLQ